MSMLLALSRSCKDLRQIRSSFRKTSVADSSAERVIEFIEGKMMPIVVRHAVSGIANINSEDLLFEDPAVFAAAKRRDIRRKITSSRTWPSTKCYDRNLYVTGNLQHE